MDDQDEVLAEYSKPAITLPLRTARRMGWLGCEGVEIKPADELDALDGAIAVVVEFAEGLARRQPKHRFLLLARRRYEWGLMDEVHKQSAAVKKRADRCVLDESQRVQFDRALAELVSTADRCWHHRPVVMPAPPEPDEESVPADDETVVATPSGRLDTEAVVSEVWGCFRRVESLLLAAENRPPDEWPWEVAEADPATRIIKTSNGREYTGVPPAVCRFFRNLLRLRGRMKASDASLIDDRLRAEYGISEGYEPWPQKEWERYAATRPEDLTSQCTWFTTDGKTRAQKFELSPRT